MMIVCDICRQEFGESAFLPKTVKMKFWDHEKRRFERQRWDVHQKCLNKLIIEIERKSRRDGERDE